MAGHRSARILAPRRQTKGEVVRMLKVSIRIHSGATRFDVAVQAESVERAIDLVRGRYSAGDVRVKSVAASFGFFEEDRAPRTDAVAA